MAHKATFESDGHPVLKVDVDDGGWVAVETLTQGGTLLALKLLSPDERRALIVALGGELNEAEPHA